SVLTYFSDECCPYTTSPRKQPPVCDTSENWRHKPNWHRLGTEGFWCRVLFLLVGVLVLRSWWPVRGKQVAYGERRREWHNIRRHSKKATIYKPGVSLLGIYPMQSVLPMCICAYWKEYSSWKSWLLKTYCKKAKHCTAIYKHGSQDQLTYQLLNWSCFLRLQASKSFPEWISAEPVDQCEGIEVSCGRSYTKVELLGPEQFEDGDDKLSLEQVNRRAFRAVYIQHSNRQISLLSLSKRKTFYNGLFWELQFDVALVHVWHSSVVTEHKGKCSSHPSSKMLPFIANGNYYKKITIGHKAEING
ncbi:hypothetical protein STEG23_033447, partial [Scotinomys teguina]